MINAIANFGIFTSVIGISTGNSVTLAEVQAVGIESDTMVFIHALDSSANLISVTNQLLNLGYVVLANFSSTNEPSSNILYTLGAYSSAGIGESIASAGFTTHENLLLKKSSALSAGITVNIRSNSAGAMVAQFNPSLAASGYINIGYTTPGYSSFGFWQKGSSIAKNGCLVNAGALFFNSTVSYGSGLSNLLLDLITLIASKGILDKYRIAGTVSDSNNQPLQRLLRAFDKASGKLVGETTSAADGSYEISTTSDDVVTVVCYHDANDTNNSQVKDDIVPILDE
ncbi:hypothetical protein CFH90_14600 [Acinetobacter johnsonii]|uniref:Uncharacterized protein n=2 Tax=Acinetobacter johnsonii TaxID=40214 RepID=A0A3Q8XF31_ACIJO|nr:hypothetical protein CFH90_14600 [Acinetobacter johnsonii]